jgi:hypothetical protein
MSQENILIKIWKEFKMPAIIISQVKEQKDEHSVE